MSGGLVTAETIARPGAIGRIKDALSSPIVCRQISRVLIQFSGGFRLTPLFMDNNDSRVTDDLEKRIHGIFGRGSLTLEALSRMAPKIKNLPVQLAGVYAVAISSRYSKGGSLSKPVQINGPHPEIGRYLFLNLDAVLTEIGGKEQAAAGKAADQAFESGKTLIMDGQVKVTGKDGTIITGYRKSAGDEMFEFAVRRLMPIDVSDVYNWDKIIKTFGQREAAEAQIGEYEAEFAISRKLFDLGNLNDTTFDNMLMTLTGGYSPKERAERLTMALKSCGGAYLFEIEGGRSHFGRELARNVREFAVERKWGIFKTSILDVMKAILKNNRIGLDKEKAAVLALMVASGKLTKERAIRFVSREPESEIADQGSLIIKYASSEENRIFTLRKVINILIGMAS